MDPRTQAMVRVAEATISVAAVTPDDIVLVDPVAIGVLRAELARLLALTDGGSS